MFQTFTDYTWFCVKILLTDVTSNRVPICNRLVLSGKDSWRSRKWCFLSNQRKYIFQLWRRKPFVVGNGFFTFLFCFVYNISLVECYKIVFGFYHLNFEDFFDIATIRSTRANHQYKLYIKPARLNCYKNSFFIRIVKLWNELPGDIVEADSFQHFKSKLKSYLNIWL